jgi:hypothetical protein
MHRFLSVLYSRLPVLAGIFVVTLALIIGFHLRGNLPDAWRMLTVHANSPTFSDTRTVTHSIDCFLSGQDPYKVRSFDPWRRLYNYPPIWLDLRYLGVTSRSSNLLGTIFAFMTISACLLLFRARTWAASVIVFLAVTSKATLFAVERGNTDEVIFFFLVLGFFLIDRQRIAVRTALRSALIVGLTVLKIFPVAAVVTLLRSRKAALTALLTVFLSEVALKLTSGSRLPIVMANTPQDDFLSFGAFPFLSAIFHRISGLLLGFIQHHVHVSSVGALLLAALSIAAGIHYREQLNNFFPPLDFENSRGSIAAAGLAIFCLAFVRGSSYDYRLIFLMGAIAYLGEHLNRRDSLRYLPAAILLVLLLWKPARLSSLFELVDALVFAAACAWLATSLLDRLRVAIPAGARKRLYYEQIPVHHS